MENKKVILPDGSVQGELFTKNNTPYPVYEDGESYEDYHKKVNEATEKGFHKGDLSWGDWERYCRGSGNWRDAEPEQEPEIDIHEGEEEDTW